LLDVSISTEGTINVNSIDKYLAVEQRKTHRPEATTQIERNMGYSGASSIKCKTPWSCSFQSRYRQ